MYNKEFDIQVSWCNKQFRITMIELIEILYSVKYNSLANYPCDKNSFSSFFNLFQIHRDMLSHNIPQSIPFLHGDKASCGIYTSCHVSVSFYQYTKVFGDQNYHRRTIAKTFSLGSMNYSKSNVKIH